ncbi:MULTISPECIES: prepilin-type N-terminal cleavage/methylation domain-containing protein [Pseudoalteromonas]|uniref:Prepilin-type N-terminal cleavage/methylation domain-containing protein n=1 Tax=Pseudoalteromonas obscura TaxID=3048491 RepID=A0ABT7EPM7_9GAMM|nr:MULTISPECIES: prepilin-type N-terminal cleavage/methylation domain-containing protein [Pseudoalteromonas]MDK2597007.1 prepilin-type N-terminal cleavage/methylation domain-containing protein [Pseudoalteromonas sp. P94(2023)]
MSQPMNYSTQMPTRSRGFSLLEILVVILIIGFSIQLVTFTVGESDEDLLEKEALKLHGIVNMASEFAVLNQVELGLHLDKRTLEFLVFDGEQWTTFEAEELYKPIEYGEEYKVELVLEDLSWAQDNLLEQSNWQEIMGTGEDDNLLELQKKKIPQVLILSSGEVSAFQVTLELAQEPEPVYYIEGEFMAPVKLRREPEYD